MTYSKNMDTQIEEKPSFSEDKKIDDDFPWEIDI